jgi:hypothetical protein
MRFVVIENNVVVNVIEWDGEGSFGTDLELVASDTAGIGYQVVNGILVAPDQPVVASAIPVSVTMRQALLELLASGYLDAVEAAIAQMPRAEQIAFDKATTVDRADPLTAAMVQVLNLTPVQTDALFMGASKR